MRAADYDRRLKPLADSSNIIISARHLLVPSKTRLRT